MIEQIKELVGTLDIELEKFDDGNKSAGTRARKVCQEIKTLAQNIRLDIQKKKNDD